MDFQFENLGPEKFQQFCHALINKEFPNSQALPVGQRDGGRDILSYYMDSPKKEFIVFQVKYVREPQKIENIHVWVEKIIKGELNKIKQLIPKGAKKYYLLTNVRGTAFLDHGTIDKVNSILEESIPIPSICWWRDDLIGKLESNFELKWSYPEILSSKDILSSILFENISENRGRRESVIRAYLADQYDIDSEVKFKQIELQNNIFDLFVDMPIKPKQYSENQHENIKKAAHYLQHYYRIQSKQVEEENEKKLGAAYFFLNLAHSFNLDKILLEGGPGQGKSTITQYVSQIHRLRLLKKIESASIPEYFKNSPVRLPFKIDLRDLSLWISKKNPYTGVLSNDFFQKNWQKSLESFLVAHIFYHSKIDHFDTNDFLAICKLSSILFVFDGFDEIADIRLREEIIEVINKGLNRLSENSKDIQVIITSRPAAFANSSRFSTDVYPHFELSDITPYITREYVENWIKSRKLRDREAHELRRIINDKLQMPHLRDLAKNPMQLAILISLVNTRGESLPNKRTALYDSYIELFFNREAEKNSTIRDKRDLIISIHQYLAWVLHSEAELYQSSGRIEVDKLVEKLKLYLQSEGHPTEIADSLFTVMRERVCALVSRIQGTFEFEVQPLREYFCAKYLYETSPYSPAGKEKPGTKPDRFDALSKNYYWQNVLRFFSGCFDKGELPMLIDKLKELQNDDYFKYTNYPRLVTSQLLSDWVFSQYPKYLKDVVGIIVNGIDIGRVLNQNRNNQKNEPIIVPKDCGRDEIIDKCFEELQGIPADDYALELIGIINNNNGNELERWESFIPKLEYSQIDKWLEYAYQLKIFHKIDKDDLYRIVTSYGGLNAKRLELLQNSNRVDLFFMPIVKKHYIESFLNFEIRVFLGRYTKCPSLVFSSLINFNTLDWILNNELYEDVSFLQFIIERSRNIHFENNEEKEFTINVPFEDEEYDQKIHKYLESISPALNESLNSWKTNINCWDVIVENGRKTFGENWLFILIANLAAGIKSNKNEFLGYDSLHDTNISLCKRVRNARLKSGNILWWKDTFSNSANMLLPLTVFFTWATSKTILKLSDLVSNILKSLSESDQEQLLNGISNFKQASVFDKHQQNNIIEYLKSNKTLDIFKYILSLRFPSAKTKSFFGDFLIFYKGSLNAILDQKLRLLSTEFYENPNTEILKNIRQTYMKLNGFNDNYYYRHIYHPDNPNLLSYDIAKQIMKDCKNLPRYIVSLAETTCRKYANKSVKPVGEIAKKNEWFVND